MKKKREAVDGSRLTGAWTMYVQTDSGTINLGEFIGSLDNALVKARKHAGPHLPESKRVSVGVVRAGSKLPQPLPPPTGRSKAKKEHAAFRASMFWG